VRETAEGSAPKPAVGSGPWADGRVPSRCVVPSLPPANCRLPSAGFSSLPSAVWSVY